jgi:hypothetical protein
MPPTLVTVAVGVLLGVVLLGAAFDRRSLAVVAVAAALPDLDALFVLGGVGLTNAAFHSVFIPVGAAMALYYDTRIRGRSWLVERYGAYGVRVAWVAVAAYAVAGIGLDAFSTETVALLYPISDRYYAILGRLVVSTQDGLVQTYVTLGDGGLEVESPGAVGTYVVESPLASRGGARRIRLVESGWQAVVVATAAAAAPAKHLIERADRSRGGTD